MMMFFRNIIRNFYSNAKRFLVIITIAILLTSCGNKKENDDFEMYFYRSLTYIGIQQQLTREDIKKRNSFFEEEYGMKLTQKIARQDCEMLKKRESVIKANQAKLNYIKDQGKYTEEEVNFIRDIDRSIYIAAQLAYCPKRIQIEDGLFKTIKKGDF